MNPAPDRTRDTADPGAVGSTRSLSRWTAAFGVVFAVVWSLTTTDYRFAAGDDGWQAPMVLHAMDGRLLQHDPLVTEISRYYRSGLFPLVAALGRWVGLAQAYACFFVLNRFLMLAAYYRFARAASSGRLAALAAVWLLTGYGYYGFGTYLSGTPLLEEKLVPRAFALPFALWGLAAAFRGQHAQVVGWLMMAACLHPVTGVSAIGLYAIVTILSGRPVCWRRFGGALALLLAILGGLAWWTGQLAGAGTWRVTGPWREVVEGTVGPWVFVTRDTAWAPALFPMALFAGTASVIGARCPSLTRNYLMVVAAGTLAVGLHGVAVDALGIHAFLEASPERATWAITSFAGVAAGIFIIRTFAESRATGKIAALALFAAVFFRADFRLTAAIWLACLAVRLAPPYRPAMALASLLAIALTLGAVVTGLRGKDMPSSLAELVWSPERLTFGGWGRVAALGRTDGDKIAVQVWLRGHVAEEALILPPLDSRFWDLARGWDVDSERSCAFNTSYHTYTHLSPVWASRYEALLRRVRSLEQEGWPALGAYAREEGAAWIVITAAYRQRHPGCPAAVYVSGPYQVLATPAKMEIGPAANGEPAIRSFNRETSGFRCPVFPAKCDCFK